MLRRWLTGTPALARTYGALSPSHTVGWGNLSRGREVGVPKGLESGLASWQGVLGGGGPGRCGRELGEGSW